MQPSIEQIEIISHPRLHLTLIGMNRGGYRINGGIGFAIADPFLHVVAGLHEKIEIEDRRDKPLPELELRRVKDKLEEVCGYYDLKKKVSIKITGGIPSHTGFGSSTAIRLSSIEALLEINNVKISNDQIISISGRGGTSGIGVHTYFDGGILLDVGRKSDSSKLAPSSAHETIKGLPLPIYSAKMPLWEIGICIPLDISTLTEKEELKFFERTCPIDNYEVYKTLYHVVYGLVAAIEENDKLSFCSAIKSIQEFQWKKSERGEYGERLSHYENIIYESKAQVVGMSSLGPALFFLAEDVSKVIYEAKKKCPKVLFFMTLPSNEGRSLKYV
ncbi:MAG: beta-ribofuranosylaminobenzene 5'-phosphate synthase family protein [Bacteroidota bacterium]|jgi:beta-ribofuranosylaminobenzene 5'-phosphate synthase